MKPGSFEYSAPATVDQAMTSLARFGEDAKILAGGQSLVPLMALRLAQPTALVDLNGVAELKYLREGNTVAVGAMTTHRTVEKNDFLRARCPLLADAMRVLGHVAIRNRGTVGGSIAHADPAAEWPAIAMVLDGEVDVVGIGGSRTISVHDLFCSYLTTSLEPDEIITEVRLSLPAEGSGSAFLELARRRGDFALAGVAAVVTVTDGRVSGARLGLAGVAGTPVRTREAESLLEGHGLTDGVLDEVARAVDAVIEPVGDMHGSKDFRRHIAGVLTKRAIRKAWERAGGIGHKSQQAA